MIEDSNDKREGIGATAFIIAGLSFIPLIGVAFGIAAIVWGLVSERKGGKIVAAIGGAGIASTVVLYSALFYFAFGQRGGVYDNLRAKMAQSMIDGLVPSIEFYKIQNGKYPDSLEQLRASLPRDSLLMVNDPTVTGFSANQRLFFYERVGEDHYYLRGIGADGIPFTGDDIVPQIAVAPGGKLGLLKERLPASDSYVNH